MGVGMRETRLSLCGLTPKLARSQDALFVSWFWGGVGGVKAGACRMPIDWASRAAFEFSGDRAVSESPLI